MAYHSTETEIRVEKAAAHEVEEKLGADAIFQAKHASDEEHNETFFQTFKNNRKAVAWSIAISLSIVMEGYDTILMVSVFKLVLWITTLMSRRATSLASLSFKRSLAETMVVTLAGKFLLRGRLV